MKHANLILVVVILITCMVPTYIGMASSDFDIPTPAMLEALEFIKGHTPPDALIITWWDYGYWVEYLARREAYVTPSQNPDRVKEVAGDFLSKGDVQWPAGKVYILVNYDTAYHFHIPMALWVGLDYRFVNYDVSLAVRLYEQEYVEGYEPLFWNVEVKIWEVEK